jgi:hypothetical protein
LLFGESSRFFDELACDAATTHGWRRFYVPDGERFVVNGVVEDRNVAFSFELDAFHS